MPYDVVCEVIEYEGVLALVIPGEIVAGLRLSEETKEIALRKNRYGDFVLYGQDWIDKIIEIKEQQRGA